MDYGIAGEDGYVIETGYETHAEAEARAIELANGFEKLRVVIVRRDSRGKILRAKNND